MGLIRRNINRNDCFLIMRIDGGEIHGMNSSGL